MKGIQNIETYLICGRHQYFLFWGRFAAAFGVGHDKLVNKHKTNYHTIFTKPNLCCLETVK